MIFQSLITLTNIPLNSLALAVLIYGKAYRETFGVHMISLTSADLGLGLFFLPYSYIGGAL